MSSGIVTVLVASGAIFSIVKIVFAGLALLVGDEGDELLRRRLTDFRDQLDRSTLSEATWWLISTALTRMTNIVSNPLAGACLMLGACVFLNACAVVLGTTFLFGHDPVYANSTRFIPLLRDVLYEFFHAQSFVANVAMLMGALATWLTMPLIHRILTSVRERPLLSAMIVRLIMSLVVALVAGSVPFFVLRWALAAQASRGSFSQFEFHLAYVLATSSDVPSILAFSLIASAAAALPALLMLVATAMAVYLYGSPRFLRDATLRLIQAASKEKAGVVNQLGTLAGSVGALSGALVTLLRL